MKSLYFIIAFAIMLISCGKDDNPGNISGNCDAVVNVSAADYENAPDDLIFINSVEYDGTCLHINYSSSGCDGSTWEVKLIDAGVILESNPPQRNLRLSLKNEELCEAIFTKNISVDISSLQEGYEKTYLNFDNFVRQILIEW